MKFSKQAEDLLHDAAKLHKVNQEEVEAVVIIIFLRLFRGNKEEVILIEAGDALITVSDKPKDLE